MSSSSRFTENLKKTVKTPLISIIIPVYNGEKYLESTLRSAIGQTWQNTEILIIDDGSTDRSLAIAEGFTDKRIKIFHEQNSGSAVARNKGITESTGEYIQFLDADDLLSPNKIERQLNFLLAHPGYIAVCSTVHFFDGQDPFGGLPTRYESSFLFTTDDTPGFLCNLYGSNNNRASMIQTNAWLTAKDTIKKAGPWAEFYSPDDDGEFFCRAVLASAGVIYTDGCFNYYRKFRSSHLNLASAKTQKAIEGKFRSFLLKKEHLLNATNNIDARNAIIVLAMNLASEAYTIDRKISRNLLHIVKKLGGTSYAPVIGGRQIEFIKRVFGWKMARSIQKFKQRFFS